MHIKNSALYYEQLGLSVIPVSDNKKPLVKWEEFQQRRATPDEIKGWWDKYPYAQVGIVTGAVSGICVIDIDTIDGKDKVMPLLGDFVAPECETPKAKLKDGIHYGRHLYFKCDSSELRNNQNNEALPGVDRRANGGYVVAPPSFEGKYEWITPIDKFKKIIQPLPYKYAEYVQQNSVRNEQVFPVNSFRQGSRDNDIFHIANTLIRGGESPDTVKEVCLRLAATCEPPFPEREVLLKVESALNRLDKRKGTLAQEVREWILSSTGIFMSSDVVKCLQVSSRDDQKNVSRILSRMVEEGLIKRYGNRNGQFRRIEGECEPLDLMADLGESIDVKFPFCIEKLLKIHPGNVIIIAGVPNQGKTAYLLNFADMNMDTHAGNMHYFSSEMGQIELKDRLKYFNRPLEDWQNKVKFYEWADRFEDVIRPDGINIVDYLEVHDEFYKVGLLIKNIYDVLKDGIAIVGLQANPGQLGLGGYRGMEKARLYLTLDNGCMKIAKGKNIINPSVNPKLDGMYIYYNIESGTFFHSVGNWRKPY